MSANVRPAADDLRFLQGGLDGEVLERTPRSNWALGLMFAVCASFIAWASWARVDQVTRAEGRVVPDGKEQVVGSLEGGILRELLVREGDLVEAQQPLAQIDPTRFASQQGEGEARRLALQAAIARLTAEAEGRELAFAPALARAPAPLLAAERASFEARRRALDDAVAGSRRSLALVEAELAMSQRLAAQGLLSEVEVLRLQRQVSELGLQISERQNRFRQDATAELAKAKGELAQQDQQRLARDDAVQRTLLRSPVRGLVKTIRQPTLGGVVAPGGAVMEILPLGPRVLVEARIKPSEIGFVKLGQPAEVKLATYDYYTYGGLHGSIAYLSPDALPEEGKPASAAEATSYRALVRTDGSTLSAGGKPLLVLPGMTATVEIRTGERTVLDFLLKPVLKSREALRER